MIEIDCYTDASYAKDVGGSIIGYKIGSASIETEFLAEIKNTEAEIIAVKTCVRKCIDLYKDTDLDIRIHIYTDCQKAMELKFNEDVVFHKMIGHMKSALKDEKQKIFTLVDKETRKKLRMKRTEKEAK